MDKHLIPMLQYPYKDVQWRVRHGCRQYDGCLRLVSNASCRMAQIGLLPDKRWLSLVLEWPYGDRNAEYQLMNRRGMHSYLCPSLVDLADPSLGQTRLALHPFLDLFGQIPGKLRHSTLTPHLSTPVPRLLHQQHFAQAL